MECSQYVPGGGYGWCSQAGICQLLGTGQLTQVVERRPADRCLSCERLNDASFLNGLLPEDFLLTKDPVERPTWELVLAPWLCAPSAEVGPAVQSFGDLSVDEIDERMHGLENCRGEQGPNGVALFSGLSRDDPGPRARPDVVVEQPPGATRSNWELYSLFRPAAGTYFCDGPSKYPFP